MQCLLVFYASTDNHHCFILKLFYTHLEQYYSIIHTLLKLLVYEVHCIATRIFVLISCIFNFYCFQINNKVSFLYCFVFYIGLYFILISNCQFVKYDNLYYRKKIDLRSNQKRFTNVLDQFFTSDHIKYFQLHAFHLILQFTY